MEKESSDRFFGTITLPNYEFTIKSHEFQKEGEDFILWFFEGIIEENPNYIDCLMYLGNAYTANRMYEEGLQVDLKLSRLRPNDPTVNYNLACSYALLKNIDASLDALEKAVELGYNDVCHIERDKDLAHLRADDRFKRLIKKMKKH